jgi:nudix-type nucleoside diphosphatase (YffH/AdpP family)
MAEIVGEETLYDGWNRFRLIRLRVNDGAVVERTIEDHGDAVVVLPYDPDRRMALLARQVRAPVLLAGQAPFAEPPAGVIEKDETAEAAGCREAMEELGVRLTALEPLGRYWSSPGTTTERAHLFLARYSMADRVAEGGGSDEHEDIEILEVPLTALAEQAARGELEDLKLLALVLSLCHRRPELFD